MTETTDPTGLLDTLAALGASGLSDGDKIACAWLLTLMSKSAAVMTAEELALVRCARGLTVQQAAKSLGLRVNALRELEGGCNSHIRISMAARFDEAYGLGRTR